MDYSLNITNEDFITNNKQKSLFDDDVSHTNKNHHSFFSGSSSQSSLNGLTPPILTDISTHYQQNPIPLIPNQNYDPFNRNVVTTQNYPVYNFPTYDFGGNTMYGDTIHNEGLITNGYQSAFNNMMIESHPRQDETTVKTNQNNDKKAKIIKEKWTHEEDEKLIEKVKIHGTRNWGLIAKLLGGPKMLCPRPGKRCRERWLNHLRPDIKKGDWTQEEDIALVKAHKKFGSKWISIAPRIPGRSENDIKNHWNATKRRMHSMKTKEISENANAPLNILENYVTHVAINNNSPETFVTTNTMEDYEDIFDGEMILSMETTTKSTGPLVNASTSSDSVLEPTESDDDYFTRVCEQWDETKKLMQGWM